MYSLDSAGNIQKIVHTVKHSSETNETNITGKIITNFCNNFNYISKIININVSGNNQPGTYGYGAISNGNYDIKTYAMSSDGRIQYVLTNANSGNGNLPLYGSTNYGLTWSTIYTFTNMYTIEPKLLTSSTGQYIYIFGNQINTIYVSSNYGNSFISISQGGYSGAISSNGRIIYVLSNNALNCSYNFGVSWSYTQPNGKIFTTYDGNTVNMVSISCSSNGKYVSITFNNYNNTSPGVLLSDDFGRTFRIYSFTNFSKFGIWHSGESSISMSETGKYQYVFTMDANTNFVCMYSRDFGFTWSTSMIAKSFISMTSPGITNCISSASGQYIIATLKTDYRDASLFLVGSIDYGYTFSVLNPNLDPILLAMTPDGAFINYITTNAALFSTNKKTTNEIIEPSMLINSGTDLFDNQFEIYDNQNPPYYYNFCQFFTNYGYVGASPQLYVTSKTGQYQYILTLQNLIGSKDFGKSWNTLTNSVNNFQSGLCTSSDGYYVYLLCNSTDINSSARMVASFYKNYGNTFITNAYTMPGTSDQFICLTTSSNGQYIYGLNTGGSFLISKDYGTTYNNLGSINSNISSSSKYRANFVY